MSFLDHLDELRRRLVASAISLGVGAPSPSSSSTGSSTFIMRPLADKLPAGSRLTAIEPTEAFMLYIKIGLLAGVVIAAPLIRCSCGCSSPRASTPTRSGSRFPFILMATVFFVAGAAFSHFLVFPWAWGFLSSFAPDYVMFAPRIEAVFSLYAMLLLAMGVVFEMPAVVLALARMGLVTAGFLWRHIKYAVLIIFVAAAVLTPTGDMVTQTLMAGPDGRAVPARASCSRGSSENEAPDATEPGPPIRELSAVAIRTVGRRRNRECCSTPSRAPTRSSARRPPPGSAAIGARAVPHLLDAFAASASPAARAAILKVLEATRDRRGLALAPRATRSPRPAIPRVAAAAIVLLGAFLDDESTQALETLRRGGRRRRAARPANGWPPGELERTPARILAPLRKRLAETRARRSGAWRPGRAPRRGRPSLDPPLLLESAADGDRGRPRGSCRGWSPPAGRTSAADAAPARRAGPRPRSQAAADAERREWLARARPGHVALAERRSRVALYDVATPSRAPAGPLPARFASPLGLVGDAACLEVIAERRCRGRAASRRLPPGTAMARPSCSQPAAPFSIVNV